VIDAIELGDVAPRFVAKNGAFMGASIEESIDMAFLVAHYGDWRIAEPCRFKVARLGQFRFKAQKIPGRSLKQLSLFKFIDFGVGIDPIGDARGILPWPDERV
jgi:hypothetical protein